MSTTAQIAANRENSLASTGPTSNEGKARSARNAVTLGLFTMNDFVLPNESAEHDAFCDAFWRELKPAGPVEETFATEMIRAAWRLRRCGILESGLAETPEQNEASLRIQNSIDRARAQANNIFRRAHNDLRRLQAEQPKRAPAAPPAEPPNGFEFSSPAAPPPENPASESAITEQTQFIPRSAPCPCGSGEKYKRCCGHNAPPLLHRAA